MTLLRDRDPARAFDHASGTYDRLTALDPGHSRELLRSARRLRLPDDGAATHILDPGCGTVATALLRPGGRLAGHGYSLTGSPAHRAPWTAVSRGVIVPAGTVSRDRALCRHLWRSVPDFDTAPAFGSRLTDAGFTDARAAPVAGWQTRRDPAPATGDAR